VAKLLVVDDEVAMRRLIRMNLSDEYEIVDTGEPEHALALALEHKPDAILLDLRMPKYSGFELCQMFTSFGSTQLIPVLVISGEAGSTTKEFCRGLGVAGYFEKPVDFAALRLQLAEFLKTRRRERRGESRVNLRVPLKLTGTDAHGKPFVALTTSENIGPSSFLCAANIEMAADSSVEVYLLKGEQRAGRARVVRSDWLDTQYPRYACRFSEKTEGWVLQ
jgi:two-component system chemotaxis response regulator CheY